MHARSCMVDNMNCCVSGQGGGFRILLWGGAPLHDERGSTSPHGGLGVVSQWSSGVRPLKTFDYFYWKKARL